MKATLLIILFASMALGCFGITETDSMSMDTDSVILRTSVKASENNSIMEVLPPSPTVAGIIKYGDIPVDYSTGIPNINIPIYDIKCGNLTMPITLSYHAGGIKVDEASSWVGLGWSLFAGGSIGGNLRVGGNSDYYPIDLPSFEVMQQKEFKGFTWDDIYSAYSTRCVFSPQWYYYNVNGYSGKIVYDPNTRKLYDAAAKKDIVFSKQDGGFSARDNFGNNYSFDVIEKTCDTKNNGNLYNTAWNLTSVYSYNNVDSISISYERETSIESYRLHSSRVLISDRRTDWSGYHEFPTGASAGEYGEYQSRRLFHISYNINTIVCSNGMTVKFVSKKSRKDYGAERIDKCSAALLDSIIVYADNKIIKSWKFNYSYFESPIRNGNTPYHLRLKLTGLEEIGTDNTVVGKYSFNYYGDDINEPQMPYRHAYSGKDKWGYCNSCPKLEDAQNSMKSFANFESFGFKIYKANRFLSRPVVIDTLLSYTRGSDRQANEEYAKSYSLKKITYPTGGTTEFLYESNHYSAKDYYSPLRDGEYYIVEEKGNGIRICGIINSADNMGDTVKFKYSEGEIVNLPHFVVRDLYSCIGIIGKEFVPDADQIYDGSVISYLEMFPEPVNECGTVNYREVTEENEDGTYTKYSYASIFGIYGNDENSDPIHSCFHSYAKSAETPVLLYISNDGSQIRTDSYETPYEFIDIESDKYGKFHSLISTEFNRGMLLKVEKFDNKDNLCESEEYEYEYKDYLHISGMDYKRHIGYGILTSPLPDYPYFAIKDDFSYNIYFCTIGEHLLSRKILKRYSNNSNTAGENPDFTLTAMYTYNDKDLIVCETSMLDKNIVSLHSVFPTDILTEPYLSMVRAGMYNYCVEQATYSNGNLTNSNLTTYKSYGNTFLPYEIAHAKQVKSDKLLYNGSADINSDYVVDGIIEYGENCRIRKITDNSGLATFYVWSNNNEYPIIEVKGIDEATFYNSASYAALHFGNDNDIADYLYETFHNKYLTTALFYEKGIGLLKIMHPDGVVHMYDYDIWGRLSKESIVPYNGTVECLKKYEYNYRK